jgi:pimeloyl-ACP methyl ester carboxylesterase
MLPRFEAAEQRYQVPGEWRVESGFLTVPEARSAASGWRGDEHVVRLYVTIIRSNNPHPKPDPVVLLSGGPGGSSRGMLESEERSELRNAILAERDLIAFDQRGTGASDPVLDCPDAGAAQIASVLSNEDSHARRRRFVTAALACRERLVSSGVNLKAFNTIESAADIDDLRRVLGYEQVNLYGISYGTRLALVAIRDRPAGLRSVVLDSTVPVQVSQYAEGIANTAYSFDLLFERVAADPAAAAAFPRLREMFHETVARLNADPDWVTFPHPIDGTNVRLPVSGNLLTGVLCTLFYSTEAIPSLPRVIWDAHHRNYARVIEVVSEILAGSENRSALGMYYCVNCCDDKVSDLLAEPIARQSATHPGMAAIPLMEFHLGEYIIPLCAAWGAREPGPTELEPVASDIPTLILAGEYDQNTPASWGRLAGETLSRSHYVEFPGTGHGVVARGECAAQVIADFFHDPLRRPDTHCVDAIPPPNFASYKEDSAT